MKRCFIGIVLALTATVARSQDAWRITAENPLEGVYYGETVANGVLGLRSSRMPLVNDGVILAGTYDRHPVENIDCYFDNIRMMNLALSFDGVKVDTAGITDYTQTLDMRHACMSSTFTVPGKAVVTVSQYALRQLPYNALSEVTVTPLTDVRMTVTNCPEVPSNLRDARFSYKPMKNKRGSAYLLNVEAGGLRSDLDIAASTSFVFGDGRQPDVSYDSTALAASFDIELKKGREYRFALTGSLISSCQVPNPRNEADRLTILAAMQGPEELVKEHLARWDGLWEGDIVIEGDRRIQQEVHSMLYHIYSNVHAGSGLSVPPMGLTGLTYNGHIFWDADIWIMPALLVLHPELARSMIDFRIDRLEQARVNAFEHGYEGAMYPWESAGSGMEETPVWALTGVFEHHVTGCVALAAWQYYCVTGDREWLAERAYPMIAAAADFWVSRATTDADGGRHIRNVCCADEYAQKVDDNAFTNAVAMLTARTAIKAAEILGREPSKAWSDLADALPVTTIANGVTSEYDGYDGAKIKQADVNLLAYPLKFITDEAQIRRDLEYYASKVPEKNTPAMTESIFALLYSRLGDADRAGHYFTRSYRDNMQPPFGVLSECKGGKNPYFLTGAGGVLQALVFGFAGYDITDDGLRQTRSVLPSWCRSIDIRRPADPQPAK